MKEIAKSEVENPESPGDGWFIIEAAGQHATRRGELEFTQNLTPEVLAGIVEAGVPAEGLPIDRDHLSLDARNSTEALGWLRELAMCDGDLAGRIEWTPLGLPLIQGKVYKHFSSVYPPPGEQLEGGMYMPERLIGLALTNQPNNKEGQPPITNRSEGQRTKYKRRMPRRGRGEIPNPTISNRTRNGRRMRRGICGRGKIFRRARCPKKQKTTQTKNRLCIVLNY